MSFRSFVTTYAALLLVAVAAIVAPFVALAALLLVAATSVASIAVILVIDFAISGRRSIRGRDDVRCDGDPDRRSDSQAVAEHQRDFYISIGPVDRLNPSCGYSVRVEEADSGLTTLFLTLKTLEDALIAARGATIELRP